MKGLKLLKDIFGDLDGDINEILPTITKNLAHKVLIIQDGSNWVEELMKKRKHVFMSVIMFKHDFYNQLNRFSFFFYILFI